VHSIAFGNPETLLGGKFLGGPWPDVAQAVQVSAYSLMSLTMACRPLFADQASVVGLTFDATVAWPAYDWMGVAKAGLESCSRYLARDLGPEGVRVNLVDARAARLGQHRPGADRQGRLRAAVGLLPGDLRRDRARRRRLPRDGRLTRGLR
jgi:enoyl-[acyl-carrier-protein] reductase (NADH)